MPRATELVEVPPGGLRQPLLLSGSGDANPSVTDQSLEVNAAVGSSPLMSGLQVSRAGRASSGSGGGSPGSMRSTGSTSSLGAISMRAGGVTQRHEEALLPYPLMRERRALAAELRTVFAACTEAFAELPNAPGFDAAVSASDCRKAIAELSSPRDVRPGAFVLPKGKRNAVLVVSSSLIVGVCTLMAAATSSWDVIWVFLVYGMMLQSPFVRHLNSQFVPDRSDSRLAKMCRWWWSMEDTKPNSLPLYCDEPDKVTFGDQAMFSPDADARGESPVDTTTSVVTLPQFLSRCMVLCVPRTRGQERGLLVNFSTKKRNAFPVDGLGYPKIDAVEHGYIRKAWCALVDQYDTPNDQRLVDVATFAEAATRCNFCYSSLDVESISAYIDTPDRMDFAEFIILQMCLFMDTPLGKEDQDRSMDPLSTIQMELMDDVELAMQALLRCCESEFAAATAGLEGHNFGVDEVSAIVFGPVLLPWLAPRQTQKENGFLTTTLDAATSAWQTSTEKWKEGHLPQLKECLYESISAGVDQPVGLEHVFDVATQLYFDEHKDQKDAIARIHAARACYELVVGSLDVMADPHELLNLMYGHGCLLDDEKRMAVKILGAEESGVGSMDLEQSVHSTTSTGIGMADVALDKVQRIKLKRSSSSPSPETAVLVDFCSWLQFAVTNSIPLTGTPTTAEIFHSTQDVRKLQQQRLRNDSAQDKAGPGFYSELFAMVIGWKGYRDAWAEHKRKSIYKRLLMTSLQGTLFFAATTMGPWYWTVFSWRITGSVPVYFAWSPLLLVLPACYFYARAESEATPDKAASRLRLICTSASDNAPTDVSMTVHEVWNLIDPKTKRIVPFDDNPVNFVILATLEIGSLIGFGTAVFSHAVVQVTPSYLGDNPGCTGAIGGWCAMYQCCFILFGFVQAQTWRDEVEDKLEVLSRVVTCSPPIIDFCHPENVVAWCRLRDHTARHSGQSIEGKSSVVTVAKISVAWAVLSALASIILTLEGAARTPYRIGCAWFGLIGGATAIIQLMCLTSCDEAVEAQAGMLESQLERIQQTLVMRDGVEDDYGGASRTSALQIAASLIKADLDSYRNTPARRFYHLFEVPVAYVLQSVKGFLLTQMAIYGWHYVSTHNPTHDGSGSAGLEEECKFFMELAGC